MAKDSFHNDSIKTYLTWLAKILQSWSISSELKAQARKTQLWETRSYWLEAGSLKLQTIGTTSYNLPAIGTTSYKLPAIGTTSYELQAASYELTMQMPIVDDPGSFFGEISDEQDYG